MTKSIMLVGVGGQGTILASKLLTQGLMEAGYDVKMNEIHGMSQRGGAVSSHIRFGDNVASPVIEKGGADILVSFELMEALRWLGYLKVGGKIVVNNYQMNPMPVVMGKCSYPEGILEELQQKAPTSAFNAMAEAQKLGNPKVMNVILLGTIIKLMNLEDINWKKIMEENVKSAFMELNLKALEIGKALV
ncbi:indolepyruvate oxidoreductase subunit beta [Desulfotomaculum sp. 1211_IL3151]|uniref:indolepyruvate oxidoreductase subunit beta n=1 Tax=Desulfotomaculum sp. 1211_IL3151 TaxID=3084055 RepID=UPI002FDAD031